MLPRKASSKASLFSSSRSLHLLLRVPLSGFALFLLHSLTQSLSPSPLGSFYRLVLTVSDSLPPSRLCFLDFLNHMVEWNPRSNACTITHSSNRKERTWRLRSLSIETLLHLNQLARSWEVHLKALDQKQFWMFWGFYFQTNYSIWLTCFVLTLPFQTVTSWDQYCNQYSET